jgi:hypothetical protein
MNKYILFVEMKKVGNIKFLFYVLFFIVNQSPILGSIHSKTTSAVYDVLCGFLIKSDDKCFTLLNI